MQARKQVEKEGKQIVLYVLSLYHTFPRPSEVILSEKEDPVEEVKVDLSQLFVGAICGEEPSESSKFLSITEGAIQN